MDFKFIIDTQLPHQLASFLRKKGIDAVHTTDTFKGHLLQDKEIVEIAIKDNRIIISKDSDFWDNFLLNGVPPKILFLQLGNIKNKELLEIFEQNIEKIIELFEDEANLLVLNQTQIIAY